jgi:hypothetical protein
MTATLNLQQQLDRLSVPGELYEVVDNDKKKIAVTPAPIAARSTMSGAVIRAI